MTSRLFDNTVLSSFRTQVVHICRNKGKYYRPQAADTGEDTTTLSTMLQVQSAWQTKQVSLSLGLPFRPYSTRGSTENAQVCCRGSRNTNLITAVPAGVIVEEMQLLSGLSLHNPSLGSDNLDRKNPSRLPRSTQSNGATLNVGVVRKR